MFNKDWEVHVWKLNHSSENKTMISTDRFTILCNRPVLQHDRAKEEVTKKYTKFWGTGHLSLLRRFHDHVPNSAHVIGFQTRCRRRRQDTVNM
ncbi:hypothetical protein QJS10_CPA05g00072 [Acorus calamus]|uniref:Uncharacterized protein n=1 Tax=Acorus calamus TaxID=4465 RepID=A0AAV9ERX8_ACOCL|nr:hypothetical protein QJS10_CPA05g00072 [Acorus calamus]